MEVVESCSTEQQETLLEEMTEAMKKESRLYAQEVDIHRELAVRSLQRYIYSFQLTLIPPFFVNQPLFGFSLQRCSKD